MLSLVRTATGFEKRPMTSRPDRASHGHAYSGRWYVAGAQKDCATALLSVLARYGHRSETAHHGPSPDGGASGLMSSHNQQATLPTMNQTLLSMVREVRNIKAGRQDNYEHPFAEPRSEPLTFHFDVMGQQYTTKFERLDEIRHGPWGDYACRLETYAGGDAEDDSRRLISNHRDTSTSPASDVVRAIKAGLVNAKVGLRSDESPTVSPQLMFHQGPPEDIVAEYPSFSGNTTHFDFNAFGVEFNVEVERLTDMNNRDEYVYDISHDAGRSIARLESFGPQMHSEDDDQIRHTISAIPVALMREFRDFSSDGPLEYFECYQ